MTLIERLLALRSPLVGSGVNHEGERFTGRMEIANLVAGRAAMLNYTATGRDGTHLHAESTLVAAAENGALCLWPVMEELPFVLPHPQTETEESAEELGVVFASGPRGDRESFREEISLCLRADGSMTYAHAWGIPGEDFDERSSCLLKQSAA